MNPPRIRIRPEQQAFRILEALGAWCSAKPGRRFLVEHGCRYGQGFLFSRPLPEDQIKPFYEREQRSQRDVA